MNSDMQEIQRRFNIVRLLAFVMLVLTPVAFVIITYVVHLERPPDEAVIFVFYAMLVIAIVAPFAYKIVERAQLSTYRQLQNKRMSPAQFATTLVIIKCVFVEASFMYGLVMFFLTADRSYMWYFYAIGVIWAVVYWPTKGKFEELVGKATTNYA